MVARTDATAGTLPNPEESREKMNAHDFCEPQWSHSRSPRSGATSLFGRPCFFSGVRGDGGCRKQQEDLDG